MRRSMRTLRSDEPRYARKDAYRGYRERDYERHPVHSPQRAPRRCERDSERDVYSERHEERRSRSPLYRLRGRSSEPSQPDYTEREATHDRNMPRMSRYPPHPRHEDRTSSYETRSPPRQRLGQGQYPPHQRYDDRAFQYERLSLPRQHPSQGLVLYAHDTLTAPFPGRAARRHRNDKAGILSTGHTMRELFPRGSAGHLVIYRTGILIESDTTTEHTASGATRRLVAVVMRQDLAFAVFQSKVGLIATAKVGLSFCSPR
jgi:hypothetical protein